MEHNVKILQTHAFAHFRGEKPWELRKNDRDYQVGDTMKFTIISEGKELDQMFYRRKIIHILKGGEYGLDKDYWFLTIQ